MRGIHGIQDDGSEVRYRHDDVHKPRPKETWIDHAVAIGILGTIAVVIAVGCVFPVVFVVLAWVVMGVMVAAAAAIILIPFYAWILDGVVSFKNRGNK